MGTYLLFLCGASWDIFPSDTHTFEEKSCARAMLSHVISSLCPSCDRISIKLQLTDKARLISQFEMTIFGFASTLLHKIP